jgi:hypothetical protein
MPEVVSIADLPFPERDPLRLLGFDPARSDPDLDFWRFGYARLAAVELESRATGERRRVAAPMVYALHSADDGEPYDDDVDLEFWLDDDDEEDEDEEAIIVTLSLFLERRAAALVGDAPALVLALCNPHAARLRRPAGITAPIFYADGDVIAFFDVDVNVEADATPTIDQVRVRLVAERWHELPTPTATDPEVDDAPE